MHPEKYVALLRAVNVGGRSVVKMPELKALFESLGFTEVATYIQTGNVVFSSPQPDRVLLAEQIEQGIITKFGYETQAFVFTRPELQEAAASNPFEPELRDHEQHCHLMFLSGAPDHAHVAALMAKQGDDYRLHVHSRVLYYAYSRALAGRRRTIDFERLLGVTGTARTWKVVQRLIEMA